MRNRWAVQLMVFVGVLALSSTACAGSDGAVTLEWRAEEDGVLEAEISTANPTYATTLYIENSSDETIHNAILRFNPDNATGAPIGFTVGTATHVSTHFDGRDHVWRLGDIAPHTRVAFSLSLWFTAASQVTSTPPFDLRVSLESESLPEALPAALKMSLHRDSASAP